MAHIRFYLVAYSTLFQVLAVLEDLTYVANKQIPGALCALGSHTSPDRLVLQPCWPPAASVSDHGIPDPIRVTAVDPVPLKPLKRICPCSSPRLQSHLPCHLELFKSSLLRSGGAALARPSLPVLGHTGTLQFHWTTCILLLSLSHGEESKINKVSGVRSDLADGSSVTGISLGTKARVLHRGPRASCVDDELQWLSQNLKFQELSFPSPGQSPMISKEPSLYEAPKRQGTAGRGSGKPALRGKVSGGSSFPKLDECTFLKIDHSEFCYETFYLDKNY